MTRITRRAFGALGFAGVAAQVYAKAPSVKSAWPDATETAAMIRDGKMSALEAARTAVDRAQSLQPRLNFLVTSDFDRALERGEIAGMTGPFAGVPFLIKDLDDYKGLPTRSGSRSMLRMPPATRQPLIDTYDKAGVNVIGKSATPEFGFLPTTEPAAFGATRNPGILRVRRAAHQAGGSGRGGRGRPLCPRQRRWWLDPDSSFLLRSVRSEALAGPNGGHASGDPDHRHWRPARADPQHP